LIEYQMRY